LQRYTIDLIIGSAVTSWGIICMLHAATQNYAQILPIRFLLGFFESAITPAFILAVGQFYTKKETISRTAFWYGFNGLALIIGGSMSYGLSMASHQHPAPRMAVWRQLYIILGALTVLFGLLALAFLPSSPGKTRLYTANEREIAASRVTNRSSGRRGAAKTIFDRRIWTQSFEALRDPRLYIIFAGLFCGSIANGGVTAYSTQLLAGFGFRIDQTLLLTLAPGGAQIISVLLFVGVSLMARSRAIGGIVLLVVAVIGSILMLAKDLGRTGHVVGYCLLNMGSPAAVALYSFNSAAVAGHGKKVIFAASSQLAYATGNM
jgi:MFS transporter, ACS family, allantoate permease